MSFTDEFRSGLNEMIAAAGTAATIGGVAVPVIDDGVSNEEALVSGGVEVRRVLTLTIARSPVSRDPRVGARVVFRGKSFKLSSYSEDDVSFTLKCVEFEQ